ncbi:NAD(P)-dependent oxidoreductase [Angustibacter luteus]|uniref:NAD(P)-dependent oxidoreductase n=1 Tax=Angustibacter luteus TaxID=658456 RepID=A0ABW1JAG0_9ACTN
MSENTEAVALLGTGTMGAGMARNIARAGIDLRVWNRTPERARPLAADGAKVCASVADAVEGADIVVTMLWDADSVERVLREAGAALAPGTVLLQMSTVGVEGADRLGRVCDELGLVHVDAPVLGTKQPAEQGALVVLASGAADEVRERIGRVLDAVGSRVVWLGAAGEGSRLKLAANAFVISLVGGIAQSVALTRELGLDPALFLAAIGGGAMDAPYVQLKGKAMIARDFTPSFGIDGGLKDADLIAAAARDVGLDPALIDALRGLQRQVVEAGHGDEDLAAAYRAYDRS